MTDDYKQPEWNTGLAYSLEIVHKSRRDANIAIRLRDYDQLYTILIGYHIGLTAHIKAQGKPAKELDECRDRCNKLCAIAAKNSKARPMYEKSLLDWFDELSTTTHKLGFVPMKDNKRYGAEVV